MTKMNSGPEERLKGGTVKETPQLHEAASRSYKE